MNEWEKMMQFAKAQAQKQTREEKMKIAIAQRTRVKRRVKTGNPPQKIEVKVEYNSSLFYVEVYTNNRIKDIIKEVIKNDDDNELPSTDYKHYALYTKENKLLDNLNTLEHEDIKEPETKDDVLIMKDIPSHVTLPEVTIKPVTIKVKYYPTAITDKAKYQTKDITVTSISTIGFVKDLIFEGMLRNKKKDKNKYVLWIPPIDEPLNETKTITEYELDSCGDICIAANAAFRKYLKREEDIKEELDKDEAEKWERETPKIETPKKIIEKPKKKPFKNIEDVHENERKVYYYLTENLNRYEEYTIKIPRNSTIEQLKRRFCNRILKTREYNNYVVFDSYLQIIIDGQEKIRDEHLGQDNQINIIHKGYFNLLDINLDVKPLKVNVYVQPVADMMKVKYTIPATTQTSIKELIYLTCEAVPLPNPEKYKLYLLKIDDPFQFVPNVTDSLGSLKYQSGDVIEIRLSEGFSDRINKNIIIVYNGKEYPVSFNDNTTGKQIKTEICELLKDEQLKKIQLKRYNGTLIYDRDTAAQLNLQDRERIILINLNKPKEIPEE